jgi:radical SAM protein with 4Fe4S-binding SPASM domain
MLGTSNFPQQCVIEVTAACDQSCIHCGRTYMERPKKTMKPEVFHRIVDEIARENPDCEVWPTFMGEALLLGKKLFPLIRYAREAGCRKLTLNSNGNRLTEENIEGLLDCGLDRFIVSCDGHSPGTYESIRVGGKFKRLYAGIHRLLDKMRETGRQSPLIELQFSIFDENQHEVEDFKKYWLDQGVVVKSRPKVYWGGVVEGGDHRVTTGPQRSPCLWSLDTMAIHWNGNVVMCAIDCEGKYVAGNVTHQTLKQIWDGPLGWMRQLQIQKRFRELPEICRRCTDWEVKKAHAFFPNDQVRQNYEDYVRRGRTFYQSHDLAPSDHTTNFTVDGELQAASPK